MKDTIHNNTKHDSSASRQTNTRQLALIGLMAAICCILGPLTIPLPFSPVPISLINLVVFFSLYALGMKKGTISYLIYILIGLTGIPVFSSFTGGPSKLFGPTGGYIIGFIFMAIISGIFIDKWASKKLLCFLGMALGMIVCYIFGTLWLVFQNEISFAAALMPGVVPFLPGDLAKIVIAMLAGPQIRRRLQKAGLAAVRYADLR